MSSNSTVQLTCCLHRYSGIHWKKVSQIQSRTPHLHWDWYVKLGSSTQHISVIPSFSWYEYENPSIAYVSLFIRYARPVMPYSSAGKLPSRVVLQGRFLTVLGWMAMLASLMEAAESSQTPNHCSSATVFPAGKINSVWLKEEPDEKELYTGNTNIAWVKQICSLHSTLRQIYWPVGCV